MIKRPDFGVIRYMSIIPYLVEKWKKLFDILWLFAVGELFQQSLFINSDICATAKGYEYIAYTKLSKNGGAV